MARAELPVLRLALVAWVAMGPGPVSAQGGAPAAGVQARGQATTDEPTGVEVDAAPGSHLEVFLMTIGPGDAIWERFSHNALVVRDDRDQTEVAYNWGIFDFNDTDFIPASGARPDAVLDAGLPGFDVARRCTARRTAMCGSNA